MRRGGTLIGAILICLARAPAASAYDVLASTSATRSPAQPLGDLIVSGNAYVFVSPESGITRVDFYLDDPSRSGAPRQTERSAPWDFAGTASDRTAVPWDTTRTSNGSHTITAAITVSGGGTQIVSAAFTVSNGAPAPVKPDQIHLAWVEDPRIMSKGDGSYTFGFNKDDVLTLRKQAAGDVVRAKVATTDTAAFHHMVATKDGGSVRLYIDGVDVTDRASVSGSVPVMANTTSPLNVGRATNGTAYLPAILDEVAIYGVALTAAQVAQHFHAGRG